jgi:hypothetical protein
MSTLAHLVHPFRDSARRALSLALIASVVAVTGQGPSSASLAVESLEEDEGLLGVATLPPVATRITVGDEVRNTTAVIGLPLPVGPHRVCFTAPEGYLAPPCQVAEIRAGELTSLVGRFDEGGVLSVVVEPAALGVEVLIGGVARDRDAVTLPVAVGEHEVCTAPMPGYTAPPCQTLSVSQGEHVTVRVTYEPVPTQDDPAPEARVDPVPQPDDGGSEDVSGDPVEVTAKSGVPVSGGGPTWVATVVLHAHRSGEGVAGVVLEGVWQPGPVATCTTDATGICLVELSGIHNRVKAVDFHLERVDGESVDGPSLRIHR